MFGCATARNKGTCDNRLNIRRDVLEASVLNGLKSHLMDPDLFKIFADEFYKEVNRVRMAQSAELAAARRELAGVKDKITRLVDAIANGVDVSSVKEKLLALEKRQDDLEDIVADTQEPEPLIHPNLAELYRLQIRRLNEALFDDDTKAEAFEVIRSLVDEIKLTPGNGDLRIDLKGELAGILSLCSGNKKPAGFKTSKPEQIKAVAGACNQRYLPLSKVWL